MVRLRTLPVVTLAAVVLGAPASVTAQVNIERLRPHTANGRAAAAIGVDVAVRTGNVDLITFNLSTRVDYAVGTFRSFAIVAGDVGWQGEETFSNQALLHVRQVFRTSSRVMPEVFEQLNYDKTQLLDFRGLLGGGLRFTLFEGGGDSRVWLGTAYMFEREHLDLPPGATHPARVSAHRLTTYLSSRIVIDERAGLVGVIYAQPQIDEPEDIRVLGDVGITAGVTRVVGITVSFSWRYDSEPPDDVESLDTTLRTGVAITF